MFLILVVSYSNAYEYINLIYRENKKSGIYRWNNLITGEVYIGSTINLRKRLSEYFSPKFLKKEILKNRSLISNSLLEYGYSNFSLDIMEYCEPKLLMHREQYYIDTLDPEYNILKTVS